MSLSPASRQFEQTDMTVTVRGAKRPVLKLGERLFAGETLSWLNQFGYEGRVWSALTLDQLQHNIDQAGGRRAGH